MLNLFADTQKQMQDLLLETRVYVGLQKQVFIAETRDKLSIILSYLAIAVVCLVLGGMVLLFFSFFLAYIIGQALDNTALGFACVTAMVVALLLIFWVKRQQWVVRPITDLLYEQFTVNDEPIDSKLANQQLEESRNRVSEDFSQLMNPSDQRVSNVETLGNWVNRGLAVYEGLRIGLSIMRALGNIFGHKRRRKK
ncbi:MAG: hypothetical protein IJ064_07065 [Bacteroidaceae bacterium]|nr:hypothetical protein [Bacteroidaceae bacterium]